MSEKIQEGLELLKNPKSKKRESGAKKLRKLESIEAGEALLNTLKNELDDKRTWSTQYHLILAIGHSKYEPALTFLKELVQQDFEATIIYMALGDSIFRLSILSNSVETSLEEIHRLNDYRIFDGAYQALAMLKLIPDDKSIKQIISIAQDPKGTELVKTHPNDQVGLRKWVASASAGWKNELKDDFLIECDQLGDQHLLMAVEGSRKGKYVKWNPY
ncbi:MAG: hypothetical protein OCD00_05895 [Colwellia sp.]